MSAADIRTDLAEAVTAAGEGLSCTPYYRQSLKPGDGFVRLESRKRDTSGIGYVDTWQIWMAIPQDVVQAEKWLDTSMPIIAVALEPLLWVTTITPSTLSLDTVQTNGVIFEGTRESD